MVIDSHHHFWQYDPVEFGWIDDAMKVIRRSFLPKDLEAECALAGVDGVISVQARQSLEETDWLLELASQNDFVKGVVGWLPLAESTISELLERYKEFAKLKAVRHVVQGQPAGFLDDPAFNSGVAALTQHDLVYDTLILENQLEEAIRFVDRHPNQRFVLDHIAKPKIKEDLLDPWTKHIGELAQRENVSCKLSGMVTEADFKTWTPEQLKPYMDTVLDAFGSQRLMFGSDWPVCLVASGYKQWRECVSTFIQPLSSSEQASIMGAAALKAYQIET